MRNTECGPWSGSGSERGYLTQSAGDSPYVQTTRPLGHHVHQQDACLTLVCPPRCGKRLSSPSHIIHELLGFKHCLLHFMTYHYNQPLTIEPTCCVRLCHRQLNKSLTLVYLRQRIRDIVTYTLYRQLCVVCTPYFKI